MSLLDFGLGSTDLSYLCFFSILVTYTPYPEQNEAPIYYFARFSACCCKCAYDIFTVDRWSNDLW
jgi:hypothetical protein